jgi:hypothetical protein
MVARLGGAICVAAITFACSSYSVSSNGIEKEITPRPVASGLRIVVASSYNPYRKDYRSGDIETVSDERYDLITRTASIHFLYLSDYVYSEDPPDGKPADTVRESLKDVPVGTPVEEIKRASAAFGLDFNFMKAVAKIESDFDPKQRTGSYLGLFQLSNNEFAEYGSGDILNARDNAIAAAYKFVTAATLFELNTHKKATISDLYLIHQQGTQGAEEHVNHPDSIAWKSMCATDEGKQKGEKWCKRAIWGNTLPEIKHVWKTVDNLTSGAFVKMWQQQVDRYYTRYSETATN